MRNVYIIGAGGVGSWLTPAICLLTQPERVIVVDGDKLEEKNLNRQLFDVKDIGENKAVALAKKYRCQWNDQYYRHGNMEIEREDWLLVGVDNNPARSAALETCDVTDCKAIIGANEVTSSEAYCYNPRWKGTQMDPRIYYPEIETDKKFDPRAAAIGCTGEAQESNRQLVSANYMAAGLMQHLFVLWEIEGRKMKRDVLPFLPYIIRQNFTKYETKRQHELKEVENGNVNR